MSIPPEMNPAAPAAGEPGEPGDRPSARPRGAMVNALWNAFATFWNIAISFFLAPLLIHNVGTAEYGLLLLIWSFTGILGITAFGMGEASLRYVAHYHGAGDMTGVNRVFGSTLMFYTIVCAVVSTAMIAAAPQIVGWMSIAPEQRRLVEWLLRLSAISFSANIITTGALAAIPMALHRYDISARIGIAMTVARSGGYVVLAIAGFGILHLVLWDLLAQLVMLGIQIAVARRLLPELRLLPNLSLRGIREIFGYSVYSFITHVFHALYRESGKLVLGAKVSPSSVAHFGTPDSVAYRIYMVLVNGSETLMPRFSANRDAKAGRDLLLNATWASLALSVVFFVPLSAVMPDLLRLWISAEFASHSAAVGRVVALCYISQAGFAPIATYFRGTGRPGLVSAVMCAAAVLTLGAIALLVPRYGPLGVGYAYLLSSIPWFAGLLYGWRLAFGRSSTGLLARSVGLPLLMGALAAAIEYAILSRFGPLNWFSLIALGTLFTGITAILVFGADWVQGDDAPSKRFVERVGQSRKVQALMRRLPVGQVP